MSNLIILQISIIFFKPHFKSTYYKMCLSDENDVRLNSIICQIENTLFWSEKNHLPARAISVRCAYIYIIEKCVRNNNICI